jgi:tripartite-type tricarboxylate transporter receptor subunit TctC
MMEDHMPMVCRTAAWKAAGIGLMAAGTLLSAFSLQPVLADQYPSRTIKIFVGFTAGGPTDVPVRYVANKLSEAIGQPVIVENKPGAASMLAIREMLSQPRDGYSLLSCTYFDPVNTLLYSHPGYKFSNIAPITMMARYDYGVVVPPDSPIKSVGDLLKFAKAHPGKLNYGHLGVGSTQNLIAKQMQSAADISLTGIPYKGAADAVRDIMAGRLDLFFGPPIVVMPQAKAGKVRIIATTGKERLSSTPDVPTLMESGVNIDAFGWIGLCAGSGTPKPIIDALNSKLQPILKSPGYKELIERSGSTPVSSTPAEMQAVIDSSRDGIKPMITKFHLRLD